MSEAHSADEKLIRMANQIATFFDSQPEDTRITGVYGHINTFWEPRMRKRLLQLLDSNTAGFHTNVVAAAGHISRPLEAV